jgi:hypothetical protein
MERDTIIRLAREAGLWPTEEWSKEYGIPTPNEQWLPELERFAALVAAAEREACVKVCNEIAAMYKLHRDVAERVAAEWCADAIKERGRNDQH